MASVAEACAEVALVFHKVMLEMRPPLLRHSLESCYSLPVVVEAATWVEVAPGVLQTSMVAA